VYSDGKQIHETHEKNPPPNGLHLPQTQRVILLLNANGRELVRDFAPVGLEPRNQRFVPLEIANHVLRVGRPRKRPRHARLDDAVARQVYDSHLTRCRDFGRVTHESEL